MGPVGSGKSSLLAAITAEISKTEGEVDVACVDQGFGLAAQVNSIACTYSGCIYMYVQWVYVHVCTVYNGCIYMYPCTVHTVRTRPIT